MNRIRFVILSLAVLFLLIFNGQAAFSQKYQSSPTDLILEVTYYSGRAPAYQSVPGPDSKLNGAWYGLFRHVSSWQPPAGTLHVKAVNILSRQEGDAVRVEVSVFVGDQFFEKEKPVASYLIRENEKITTSDLTEFGVEPFEIKVVRTSPIPTNLPQIVNRTESIAVLDIDDNGSTLPSYKLLLRNNSGKNVVALGINVIVNNRERVSWMPQGKEGQLLIAADSNYELNVHGANDARLMATGYTPDAPPNQEIHIDTVIFEDGSYEGLAEIAATFRGFTIGDKIQIGKVVQLIQDALKETDPDTSQAIRNFKMRVSSLSSNVDERVVDELRQAFPSLDAKAKAGLKISIEVSLNRIKFDFIKCIEEFEKSLSQRADANAFQAWLSINKERFEKWLSRL